ncbi:MAG: hypothetical protein ACI90M_002988, partial [Candidatus Azotimanducaceae bacterium]
MPATNRAAGAISAEATDRSLVIDESELANSTQND